MEEIDKQQVAIDAINNGENVFISGPAGTGKSYITNLTKTPKTLTVAPTGIAALNVGGSTCHKVFQLPLGVPTPHDMFKVSSKMRELFSGDNVDRIVIDEIGMSRADQLDCIDSKLRALKGNNKPFGGIPLVATGDFYQIEPVLHGKEARDFSSDYNSPFAFDANCWDFKVIELTKVYRQSNKRQVKLLNSVRVKDKNCKIALGIIQKEAKEYDPYADVLHLCCFNADANSINKFFYKQNKERSKSFSCIISGDDSWSDSLVPHKLDLKVGCKVVFCANHQEDEFKNGEQGVVVDFKNTCATIRKSSGDIVNVYPHTWEKFEYVSGEYGLEKEVTGTFTQLPIKLGYAVSIHKSQGMTLDEAVIDVGTGCFSHGQLYVALSRVRDLKNIAFANPIDFTDIIVDKRVKDFYRRVKK